MLEGVSFFLVILAVLVLCLDAWAIGSVWRSQRSTGNKVVWALLILLLPVIGLAIWGFAGPRGLSPAPSSPEHSK